MRTQPAVAVLIAVLASFTLSALPASAAAAPPATPPSGLLFGAFAQPRGGEDSQGALGTLEAESGRKMDLHRVYARWDDPLPNSDLTTDVGRGRTPVLSIRPQRRDGSTISWAAIASGAHDTVIAQHAGAVAGLGAPVFVAFHHEPDQASGYGTPADYVAAWRRYVSVFASNGASNVAWTWIMTPSSFGSQPVGQGADAFYPGDDVVDWLALDPYNWFGCAAGKPTAWRSLAEIIDPFRAWGSGHDKPLMLAEWGSVEDPNQPGRKAAWIAEALSALADRPEFKAAVYFHAQGNCPWWLDSSDSASGAFADAGATATAHGRTSSELLPSTTLGAAPLAVSFDGSRSAGAGSATGSGIAAYSLDFGDGSPVVAGGGTPPSHWVHTYSSGTFVARLEVTAHDGTQGTDTRTIRVAAPPAVTASETDVGATTATLHAWVNPNGLTATAYFEWGKTTAYGNRSQSFTIPAQTWPAQLDVPVAGLAKGTRYHWRVVASSDAGTTTLADRTFDTIGPPTVTTSAANQVTGTSATLNGQVHPHSLATTTWFEWGRTTAYGSRTPTVSLPAATWAKPVSAPRSGLARGTTYHFRTVAQNAQGISYGPDRVFTTSA